MSDNETPIEKAVELLVYAPIGLAMFAKDTVPTFMKMFVARGQTEITQRRKDAGTHAGNYKTIGKLAVKYGTPEVKRQAGAAAETVRRKAEESLAAVAAATATPESPQEPPRPTDTRPRAASTPAAPPAAPTGPAAPTTNGRAAGRPRTSVVARSGPCTRPCRARPSPICRRGWPIHGRPPSWARWTTSSWPTASPA